MAKKKTNQINEYENWKDEKAERREKKKIKKMPVHGAGLYEVWKMKMERKEKSKGEK